MSQHDPSLAGVAAYNDHGVKTASDAPKKLPKIDWFKTVFTLPICFYALLLIALPLLYVLFLSFLKPDNYGGYLLEFNLENYGEVLDTTYLSILLKSAGVALATTFICLLIAYPFAIFLRGFPERKRNFIMKLVMVPFLTNSLIRTYGLITLLRKHGVINLALLATGAISAPLNLMYNNLGILIGMVYTLLPFMLLPVCSAVQKVDQNYLDAASDLGAGKFQKFFKIYLPLTLQGAFNGSLMVFIPAIGYFFIADILGGGKAMIIGNLIKNQFLTARNWPLGAALSIVLLGFTFLLVRLYRKIGGNLDELGGG